MRGGTSVEYFDFFRSNATGALHVQGNQTGFNNICLAPTSGNVGIGTTSPATANSRLTVAGGFIVPAAGFGVYQAGDHLTLQAGAGKNVHLRPNDGGVLAVNVGTASCDMSAVPNYGLKLPATPGNADAQTLDCYQENPLATTAGNGWTPTIGGTAAQWGGTLPTVSFARYVQIGSIVFCDVRLTSASIQSTYGVTTITPPPPAQNAFATEVVVPASTTAGGVTGNGAQFGGVVYLPTLTASTAIRLTWFYFTTS
jgi:hypothetical protein